MQRNATGFEWTSKREQAAIWVAEDKKSDDDISSDLGINRATLHRWKQEPVFLDRVQSIREEFRQAVLTQSIADRVNRIRRLDDDWLDLQLVKQKRAASAKRRAEAKRTEERKPDDALEIYEDYPGMMTGQIVRVETPVKNGIKVEYQIDTSRLAELRNIEKQAAIELGQWTEKQEQTVNGSLTIYDEMSLEELNRNIEEIEGGETPAAP